MSPTELRPNLYRLRLGRYQSYLWRDSDSVTLIDSGEPGSRHGVVFTGDIAAEYQDQVILGVFNLDRDLAAASLRSLAELNVETACFGHGEPVLDGAAQRLRAVRVG